MKTIPLIGLLLSVAAFSACGPAPKPETKPAKSAKISRDDLGVYYTRAHVEGCFGLYDDSAKTFTCVNEARLNLRLLPASTFKICNSLIGLETGVIPDEHFVLKWDGRKRWNEDWNHDQDMKEAIRHSTVWYYQELARRVGGKQMKYWLDKAQYGNADTSGRIDTFWLSGGLRISPNEQIDFLQQLHDNTLPFSKRTMNIVKDILILKDSAGTVLRGKTGWGPSDKDQVGWFVGYVEKRGHAYYFANCIYCRDLQNPDFVNARKEIALRMLKDLKVLD